MDKSNKSDISNKKLFYDRDFKIGERKEALNTKLAKQIFEELEEFEGKGIEKIAQEYWLNKDTQDKLKQEDIERNATERKVFDYYAATPQYLYELGYWEAQDDKQREYRKLYLACKKFNLKRVLDYGGGIGGLPIYLNPKGILCDYLDVPGRTFDFALFRFKKRGVEISCFDVTKSRHPVEPYDAVISYDVLEHVYDIDRTLDDIYSCLRQGGIFIHRSTFATGGIHLRKHELYQDFNKFNEFLNSKKFSFIGRLKADRFSTFLNKAGLRNIIFSVRVSKRLKYGGNFLLHRKS